MESGNSIEQRVILWWAAGGVSVAQFVLLLVAAPGYDEAQYVEVIHASIRVWPAPNLEEVLYGTSFPFQYALATACRITGFDPLVAGRIVSLGCWLACVALLLGKRHGSLAAVALLFNPFVLLFAVRSHPTMPALLFVVLIGISLARSHLMGAAAASFFATNVYNLNIAAGPFAPLASAPWLRRTILYATVLAMASLAGLLANWVVYGGQYPESFKSHHVYKTLEAAKRWNFEWVPLGIALAGMYCWILDPVFKVSGRRIAAALAIVAAVIASTLAAGMALGPLRSIALAAGNLSAYLYGFLLGVSAARFAFTGREGLCLLAGTGMALVPLLMVALYFERYAWFAILPVLILWAMGNRLPGAWLASRWGLALYLATVFLLYAAYTRFGSL